MPSNTRTKVVLPAPLGPISVTISPAATSMSTSCSKLRPPRESTMPWAAINSRRCWGSPRRPLPRSLCAEGASPLKACALGADCPPDSAAAGGWRSCPSMIRLLGRPRTIGTQTPNFHYRFFGGKGGKIRRLVDRLENRIAVDLGHRPAGLTRQHQLAARLMAGVTGEIGIPAFEAVHDAYRHQGINGAIDRDRGQPLAARRQPGQHLVGANGLVRGGDLAEHRAAQAGQLEPPVLEGLARPVHRLGEAMAVVMLGRGKGSA